jgi:predicted dehydrogenase
MEDLSSHNGSLAGSHNGIHAPSIIPVPAYSRRRQMRGVAIVGLGYWGPNWVRNFSQIQGIERVVCCDFSRPRLDHIKSVYPSVVLTDQLDRVLDDPKVDAVIVATPVNTHFEIASRCLKAGKSTLVEKPLATSCDQAEQLIRMARERDLTLMSGHTFEYSAPVLKIRELIDDGELGDIFYISSVRANLGLFRRDVNVAWDLATHDISIILMLLGEMPLEVTCQGESHYHDNVEDVAMVTLRFANKVIAYVHVSWLDPNKIRRTTIVGSRKMLVYDDTVLQEKVRVYDKGVTKHPYYDTYGDFQLSYRYGDVNIPRIDDPEPLKVECDHFVDCVRQGISPNSDGLSGLRVVRVLEAADRSLKNNGKPMPVMTGKRI